MDSWRWRILYTILGVELTWIIYCFVQIVFNAGKLMGMLEMLRRGF